MAKLNANLTKKDKRYRQFAQNGSMWRVLIYIGIPLALYQCLGMLFRLFDNMMAAHISTGAVAATAFIHQITMAISAIGSGLAIGSCMKISEAYGAGDFILVKRRISTVYTLCGGIGGLLLIVLIPFSKQFLILGGTPEPLAAIGNNYFRVELAATVLNFFNTVYISIERARGNARRILYINMIISGIKLAFSAVFVYLLNGTVTSIAVATLISQLVLLTFALINMQGRDNAFGFSLKAVKFNNDVCGALVSKSVPVFAEKFAFSFGKIIVNNMSKVYGNTVAGALGISNNISGIASSLQNGFQEGGASIISQNMGAGNKDRALDAFKKILIINIGIGVVFFFLTIWQIDFISSLFAGDDDEFRQLVKSVYSYEAFAAVALGINAAVMALLYGFGLTKLSLLLNFSRVFVFRVPVLWFLQNYTDMGSKSVGVVMMVSNISVAVVGLITAFVVVRKIKKS